MLISPLTSQGQSTYRIVTNHPELGMSVRTLYTYLDDSLFTARNIDLKRKVKLKPRKCHNTQVKDRTVFQGRMHTDFQSLAPDHWTEVDTVHFSTESKKVLLTFFLKQEKPFLAFLMNRCTKGAVHAVFDRPEKKLGTHGFLCLFCILLTDRGSEFGDSGALETGMNGMDRTNTYYRNPMRSGQKGGVGNVHTLLRMVLPKGISFAFLIQWDVDLIVNHINSPPRESLSVRTPYAAALETYGEDALKALQLRPIDPDEVNLTPKLVKYDR